MLACSEQKNTPMTIGQSVNTHTIACQHHIIEPPYALSDKSNDECLTDEELTIQRLSINIRYFELEC